MMKFREFLTEEKLKCPECGSKAYLREDGRNAQCKDKKCNYKDELSKFKEIK